MRGTFAGGKPKGRTSINAAEAYRLRNTSPQPTWAEIGKRLSTFQGRKGPPFTAEGVRRVVAAERKRRNELGGV